MKILILLSFIIGMLPLVAHSASCNGALGNNHTNPDGGAGGFVAKTASVTKTVTVDASSSVCERAKIQGNVRLERGSEVSGSANIEGNSKLVASQVFGGARIFGNAVLINSKVCQLSTVNYVINNSDHLCQTDDPEAKDPGEAAHKTLLGIDSDADGVRDDVEIWINNITTNTELKNYYNARMAMKQIAKEVQANIRVKDNKEASIELGLASDRSFECLRDVSTQEDYQRFSSELQIQIYGSSMERLKAWAKTRGNLSGQRGRAEESKKGWSCGFKIL